MPGTPGVPSITKVDASFINIKWLPPTTDGGSPITEYVIEQKDMTSSVWTKANTDHEQGTASSVSNLTTGEEYEFRVAAVNKAGQGGFSGSSERRMTKLPYSK